MALKLKSPVRLLIADDVGIGKTVEALLILKELLDRGEIARFAIIVLPHLCEQWQAELRNKFGIEAVIIRTNTQARLDREIQGDPSVYHYYPFQIISIDYIKSDQRRQIFIQECPEMVIVDEAHTCANPVGSSDHSRQQRHALIKAISKKPGQNLILLTATPHSGKQEEFGSLLGLLDEKFGNMDIPNASRKEREELAGFYVQRRRGDVEKWLNDDTPFPKRDSGEVSYELSPAYEKYYNSILNFCLGILKTAGEYKGKQKFRYWSVLGLLRGVMSSPVAGISMLDKKLEKTSDDESGLEEDNPVLDEEIAIQDMTPETVMEKTAWSRQEISKLRDLSKDLKELIGIQNDWKAAEALKITREWIKSGFNPIIFCRYIHTAKYLGELLKGEFKKLNPDIQVLVITSEDPDEIRKSRIDDIDESKPRLMIATDCLSEGVNLQDKFTAVLHYDLPWNPNRLEQREGRIDRYGQNAPIVKTWLLYGKNNPIDGVVLKILLNKIREIRKNTGISIPFPEDSKSLLDSVMQALFIKGEENKNSAQLTLDFGADTKVKEAELEVSKEIEKAARREEATRSIFAQHAIHAEEIEQDLKDSDEAIGNPEAVEHFVTETLKTLFGVQIDRDKKVKGYTLYKTNLPDILSKLLPDENVLKVSFYSPTPEGYIYLGRNHEFVEQLCQMLLSYSMEREKRFGPARASVVKTKVVSKRTVLLLFRVRNVIQEKVTLKQIVTEEMLVWGYEGSPQDGNFLGLTKAKELMETAQTAENISIERQTEDLQEELNELPKMKNEFNKIAITRSDKLIEAHERFRKVLGGKQYKTVEPILPMDLMGIYILIPDTKESR